MNPQRQILRVCGTLAVALLALTAYGRAQTAVPGLATLYSFQGPYNDGGNPNAALGIGSGGLLYGTTTYGGSSNDGTVFSLTPPASPGGAWTETVLHSFTGVNDGAFPATNLAIGRGGVLYGTTQGGGDDVHSCAALFGCGTVFSLTPPASPGGEWTETLLYVFRGRADGSNPIGITMGGDGVFYGTTNNLRSAGVGTVFSLTPPASTGGAWTETVLYTFTGTDGGDPQASVTIGKDGVLYGTTASGGPPPDLGVVFSLKPPASTGGAWTETVLLNFIGIDGANPTGKLAIGSGGVLYGTCGSGGTMGFGTAFSLTPPASPGGAWTETVLHTFANTDGAFPVAGLVIGSAGVLVGATSGGGTASYGTVFALTPPAAPGGSWTETVLHSFTGPPSQGSAPVAGLTIGNDGVLYGTTNSGGAATYWGTVFALRP